MPAARQASGANYPARQHPLIKRQAICSSLDSLFSIIKIPNDLLDQYQAEFASTDVIG
jgi:hypothetical protein